MEKWKLYLVIAVVELLFVVVYVVWANVSDLVPLPGLVAVALLWVLAGSALTFLLLSLTEKSTSSK